MTGAQINSTLYKILEANESEDNIYITSDSHFRAY
jgi:hypothetical protein